MDTETTNELEVEDLFPDDSEDSLLIEDVIELPPEENSETTEDLDNNFDDNLAKHLSKEELDDISKDVLKGVEADLESREPWENMLAEGIKYLGIMVNDSGKSDPNSLIASVNDPIMLMSWLSWMCNTQDILSEGPCDYTVDGPSDEEIESRTDNRVSFENNYLMVRDVDYKRDFNRLRAFLGLTGCSFKKIYLDPVSNLPKSRFIKPQDMILDNNANSLDECERITQCYYLSRKDISLREKEGFFIESGEISEEKEYQDSSESEKPISIVIRDIYGIEDNYDKKSLFRYLEVHTFLDNKSLLEKEPESIDYPIPYILHICAQTKRLVGIYRGWKKEDKNKNRQKFFAQYNYTEGLGLYGFGIIHYLMNAAKTLTSGTRLYLDSMQFSLYPGLLAAEGSRIEHKSIQLEPGQVQMISTMGMPINQSIMPLPYPTPSPTMMGFLEYTRQLYSSVDGTVNSNISDLNQNAPVGSTLAMLEVHHKMQSMVMANFVESLGQELRMIDRLFREVLKDEPFVFYSGGKRREISSEDFLDNITIIPSFKSDISTKTQKMMVNDAILRLTQMSPALYNIKEAHKRILLSMKVDDIDSLLLKDEEVIPMDPVTENMRALQGKAIKAAEYQDHMAHIAIKQAFLQRPEVSQNQLCVQILNANILEHYALQYKLEMEQKMGEMLPPLDQIKNPEVQNSIAMAVLPIAQQQQEAQKAEQPGDPVKAMMADVEQKREAALLKAETDKKKVELEAYKAQLKFEGDKEKMDAEMQMAEERNETNLEIEEMKHQPKGLNYEEEM